MREALNEPGNHFKKAKEKYRAEHNSELTLFKAARRILKEFSPGKKVTDATVADWQSEVAELKASLEKEAPQVKAARDEMLKLRGIQGTLESYLKPRRERNHEQER